jgi:hypothetical protein
LLSLLVIRMTASHRAVLGGPVRRALAASVAVLLVSPWVAPAAARAGTPSLPADPAAHGYIGLCDEHGNNVSGGSIDSAPFVWKAVASVAPPAAYLGRGENAVLNIYQPRPDSDPQDWSGDSLTAASFYSTRSHPAVQATYADGSLSDFMQEFPPLVDGLYQLRIYFGKINYGLYNATYPATTIRVDGSNWSVVDGGTVNYGGSRGVSNEALTGAVPKADTVARSTTPAHEKLAGHPSTSSKSAGSSATRSRAGSGRGGGTDGAGASRSDPGRTGASPVAHIASTAQPSNSHTLRWLVVAAVAVLLAIIAFAAVLLRRHRARVG